MNPLWALAGWVSGALTVWIMRPKTASPTRDEVQASYRVALRGAKQLTDAEINAIGVIARTTYWPGFLYERAVSLIDEAGA